jgi:hypothetical protein
MYDDKRDEQSRYPDKKAVIVLKLHGRESIVQGDCNYWLFSNKNLTELTPDAIHRG